MSQRFFFILLEFIAGGRYILLKGSARCRINLLQPGVMGRLIRVRIGV